MNPVIEFDHVSKRYRRYSSSSFRELLSTLGRKLLFWKKQNNNERDWFWAVKDVSFEVMPGKTIGVIGPNGAGKTTTLKLLSRITQPTTGQVKVNGRVSALIELGAGFHPDLTGRENVFLNGTILGLKRKEIARQFEEIVEFADLKSFIDTPVKYYSSGMYARLGFAVAAHTNPDLLLVDEVLAVGDYSFQQKCYQRMRALQQMGTTILLVSHNLAAINDICSEVIVMNKGQRFFQGSTAEGIAAYASLIRQNVVSKDQIQAGEDGIAKRLMTHQAKICNVTLLDQFGEPVRIIKSGETVFLAFDVQFLEDAPHPNFSCFINDEQGRLIYDQTTHYQGVVTPSFKKGQTAKVYYRLKFNVVDGIYNIGLDLHYSDLSCYYDRMEAALNVIVDGKNGAKGIVDFDCQFQFENPFQN